MIPNQPTNDASSTIRFLIALAASFAVCAVVMKPIMALSLGLPLFIVLPMALGVGAFAAAVMSWALARMLNSADGRGSFLAVLAGGEMMGVVLLIALFVLTLSGFSLLPWILTIVACAAVIAYRTTALAWWGRRP